MNRDKLIRLVIVVAGILCIPLLGNIVSEGPDWSVADFVIAGGLLVAAGLVYEVAKGSGGKNKFYRFALGITIAGALLLMWMNLAVGIIGSENNPVNLLFFGVIGVLLLGSIIARLRAPGMRRVLEATALTQFLVPLVALSIWKPPFGYGVIAVLILNTFFVGMWLTSSYLFRKSISSENILKSK